MCERYCLFLLAALVLPSNTQLSKSSSCEQDVHIMETENEVLDVAIVGGGLSGLAVAHGLAQNTRKKLSFVVLEASNILGGRLRNTKETEVDLGGAWIWPMYGQRNIADLVMGLGLKTMGQVGDSSSVRIVGGAYKIITSLADQVGDEHIKMDFAVTSCVRDESKGIITLKSEDGKTVRANKVVFAAPPRIVYERVTFKPELPESKLSAMKRSQTWMAGVTKVAIEYASCFWPKNGAVNTGLGRGPAFQMYDASSEGDRVPALTFFTLAKGYDSNDDLIKACIRQLGGYWEQIGLHDLVSKLSKFTATTVQRWPNEKFISDDVNPQTINPHPSPVKALGETAWGSTLLFAGTETDQDSPGVMEGAVSAAKRVLRQLSSS
eukprot:m.65712 g.65712  ORF g.65712 m.65712 type:complete len:379 (+) comp11754_c0_seq2:143-1279(+)